MKYRNYILYIITLLVYIYLINYILMTNESLELFERILFINFLTFVLGLLVGFSYLYNENKKTGRWSLNYIKLIIICVPLFIVFLNNIFILPAAADPLPNYFLVIRGDSYLYRIYGVLFGYFLTTCFYKKNDKNHETLSKE